MRCTFCVSFLFRSSFAPAFAALTMGAMLSGCPAEQTPLDIPEGCQPLYGGGECLLPYPSDFFLIDDETMPSGKRIEVPEAAKPITDEGLSGDPNEFWTPDGFSTNTPIVFTLPFALGESNWVNLFDDQAKSTTAAHPTVIVDTETGELIPHFVDVDPRGAGPNKTALVLHPLVPLEEQRRYVIGVHGIVADRDGEAMPVPAGMARLVADETSKDPALAAIQGHYNDSVFPVLASAGVNRDAIQLAFDFTTGSDERTLDDMFRAREIALEWLLSNEPVVEIDAVFEDDPAGWRVIKGTVIGPMINENQRPGAELFRGPDGRIAQNGEARFAFTITVPRSVRDSYAPGKLVLFGHGFFGTRAELEGRGASTVMHELGAVGVAIDWWGLSGNDVGTLINALSGDVHNALLFTDRIPQAMVNWLVMIEALKGPLQTHEAFSRPTDLDAHGVVFDPDDPNANNAGQLLYDDEHVDFTGFSLGHILGGVLCAIAPAIEQCILHVGGAGLSHIMFRSNPFLGFLFVLDFSLTDPLDHQKVAVMMQAGADRIDPGRYAPYLLDEAPLFGPENNVAQKRVLMQVGVGDASVPNFSSYYHARALGLPLLEPAPVTPYGFEVVSGTQDQSALNIFDMGEDDSFYETMYPPADPNPVHDDIRLTREAQAQMKTFLETNVIEPACDAPCVVVPAGLLPETED